MKLNQLEQSFKVAMEELIFINGRLFVLDSFVTQTKQRIENDNQVGHELMTSAIGLRNITVSKHIDNLFLPSEHYKLNRDNLKDEVDMILSRECLFQISQAYEMVETYLYNQVAELVVRKNGLQLFIDSKRNTATFVSTRKALKSFADRKNNKHLLAILRANCEVYSKFETSNIYDMDFSEWYEMFSEVRHCITHNRTELTRELKNLKSKSYLEYFATIERNSSEFIFTTFSQCAALLSRVADFIFFVFKAVSERCFDVTIDFDSIQHFMPDIYTAMVQQNTDLRIRALERKYNS